MSTHNPPDVDQRLPECPTEPCDAISMLRRATAQSHRRLDQLGLVRNLYKDNLDPVRYRDLLIAFRNAYLMLEPVIRQCERQCTLDCLPAFASRLSALDRDLGESESPFRMRVTGFEETWQAYWGMRYVVDGSCHGALVLLSGMRRKVIDTGGGLAYWRLLAGIKVSWPALVSALNAQVTSGQDLAKVIAAARLTFDCFITCLLDVEVAHERTAVR